jgi:hypothetical protein
LWWGQLPHPGFAEGAASTCSVDLTGCTFSVLAFAGAFFTGDCANAMPAQIIIAAAKIAIFFISFGIYC